jgi:hypothetical protein
MRCTFCECCSSPRVRSASTCRNAHRSCRAQSSPKLCARSIAPYVCLWSATRQRCRRRGSRRCVVRSLVRFASKFFHPAEVDLSNTPAQHRRSREPAERCEESGDCSIL